VRAAIEFLGRRLDRPVRLPEVAKASGLSVSRLARLFRAQTGTTIQRFLETQRLRLARQRLALTGEPIGAIAEALGFANPFYFTRRFTRDAGMSPRAFRRRAQR
jgi:AraC-like DNA-binding protein